MSLLVELKKQGQLIKTWKLRPSQGVVTFGSSSSAGMVHYGDGVVGLKFVFSFNNGIWTLTDLSLGQSADAHKDIKEQRRLEFNGLEMFITPFKDRVSLYSSSVPTGDEIWVRIYQNGIYKESYLLPGPCEQKLYDGEVYIPFQVKKSSDWVEERYGIFLVKYRSVAVEEVSHLKKVSREDFMEKGQEKYVFGGLIALALLALLVFVGGGLKPSQQKITEYKEITLPKIASSKRNTKKPDNAINKAMSQALPPSANNGNSGKVVGQVISKIRTAGLSKLIAKVSVAGQRSANVVINKSGVSAKEESAGRAIAAIGKIGKGFDLREKGSGADSGLAVNTKGLAGGGSVKGYGQMNSGQTGERGIDVIEEESEIDGGLDREVIAEVIRSQLGQILYCYERQLSATPNLFGKVAIHFVISPLGTVETQKIKETSLRNHNVENCILQKVARWRFPQPKGGTKVVVSYPFMFKNIN